MTLLGRHIRQRIDKKLRRLEMLRPLDRAKLEKLREQLQIEMTYNSNAIEGNSLSLRETALVLQEGLTIRGKPLKDHLEAKDHKEALSALYSLIEERTQPFSEYVIRELHHLVVRETDSRSAGKYRTGSVMILGTKHVPPEAGDVPARMHSLMLWCRKNEKTMHPVELAAIFHHRLAAIHPFFDGNGRTARLATNLFLMRKGYPLCIILRTDRKKYYRVLRAADLGRQEAMVLFTAQAVERSLDLYLRAFDRGGEGLLTLSQASKGSPYSAKYLNLLARIGRLDAFKLGRVWYTTSGAIEKYREGRLRQR